MDQKEIEQKIEELVLGIGATCEFLATLRDMLMKKNFTREEAVQICSDVMVGIITKGQGK